MDNLFSLSPNYSAATKFFRHLLYAVVMIIITAQRAAGQISPGDLSSSHAQLEGMNNCTQCHMLGKTISSERCLACHAEIRTRLEERIGLHGRNKYEQCIDCHKEHHGRDFSIRKIDTKSFDHSLTGYMLKGKHINLDCGKCHEEEKIRKSDVGQKTKEFKAHTYLGLLPDCSACHRDVHFGQLSPRCEQCHILDGWKPAANFSHANAAYKLTGKHETVECVGCHKKTLEKGTAVQYVHLEFAACSSCHSDAHRGKFNQSCQSCHTTAGWREGPVKHFDHSLTRYPLRGKHASVKCDQCHTGDTRKGKATVASFAIAKFKYCSDCHADAHEGQFAHRTDQGKCESCHSEVSFIPSNFSVADHHQTRFELTGAHVATSCTACHSSGAVRAKNSRIFRWTEELRCLTCHADVHKGQFQSKPKKECEVCHSSNAWNTLIFSHVATQFPLLGKHSEIPCTKCHTNIDAGLARERIQYRSLSVQCMNCHRDEHEGQFANVGRTDCSRCHSAASWKSDNFNHTLRTRYELTGKHATVPCGKCHMFVVINRRSVVRYKPLGTTCIDCHPTNEEHDKK